MIKLYQEFLNKIERFIPDQPLKKEIKEADFISLFQTSPLKEILEEAPSALGVFNNMTLGYEFLTDNIKEITGHDKSIFMGPDGMQSVISTFKTEHAEIHNKYVFPMIFEYFHKSKGSNITKHRFTTVFQVKTDNEKYKWCMQQIKVIATNENSYPALSLVSIADISAIKKDDDIDFTIACKDAKGVFQNIYAISIPASELPFSFSKREIEILTFIKKGFYSKEIAEALGISEHTVTVHRKNILKKSNGLNMAEVVQFMSNKNFLNS